MAICLVGFSGFLRISEFSAMQIRHVVFTFTHVAVTIPKAKYDQSRERHIGHMPRSGSRYCLVHWLEKYINATGLSRDSNTFVISRLDNT